ncbi:UNVERIFIED_CONTAM: hypothetical protein GTU68_060749 [Idotea baltica]|nr:hypothetical protein [Idotea baltica]
MVGAEIIGEYFDDLSEDQLDKFARLGDLYKEWNSRINVISRKDIDQIYEHHILHALLLAKFFRFVPGTQILDLGTGGGFPGLPLAIFFPEVQFTLIDGIRKKIKVVEEIQSALNITNITAMQKRAEEHKQRYDFVVARAVTQIDVLWGWCINLIKLKDHKNVMPNGLIAYKGGKLKEELQKLSRRSYSEIYDLKDVVSLPYYEEKAIVYIQR